MKLFLLLVVFICCTLLGISINKHFVKRENFYKDLCSFLKEYRLRVSFSRQKILCIIDDYQKQSGKEFGEYLKEYQRYINCNLCEKEFRKSHTIYFLNNNEKDDVAKIFLSLGSLSAKEEIERGKGNESIFLDKSKKCMDERIKFSSLYLKLFIVLALFVFIIFI